MPDFGFVVVDFSMEMILISCVSLNLIGQPHFLTHVISTSSLSKINLQVGYVETLSLNI